MGMRECVLQRTGEMLCYLNEEMKGTGHERRKGKTVQREQLPRNQEITKLTYERYP
jgi:hypothetical protein